VEVEEELEEKVEVEVEVWRSRRSRKRGGDKVVSGKLLYQFLHSHYEYLLIPPFLRYMPTNHGVRFCSGLETQPRVGMTPQYFAGILIPCMETMYILFMSHMHALLDLQHGSKSLL